MATTKELLELRESATARGVSTLHPIFAAKAKNAEIWDTDGKRYIDLAAGIAVMNVGHNHPAVIRAVESQLGAFSHTCFQVTPYEVYLRLADRLNKLAPGMTKKKTIFLTTGAEAVENAIKIARFHTGRSGVISFAGGFHGRTMLCLGLTGKVQPYKAGFGPFPGDLYHAPYPIDYHGVSVADALRALDQLLKVDIEASRVAAIIVEPMQGEGGFYPAPKGFLKSLRQIADRHGMLLIVDEIQTGFGRTGRLFACEHERIEPDLITVAKSLAGGFPLSGVIGKAEVMDSVPAGGLGGTYGGSPIACAAGLAVLDVIEREKLCERALDIGQKIRAWGEDLRKASNCVGDLRVAGAMSAIEIVKGGDPTQPDPDLTKAIVAEARRQGVILLTCGVRGNVVRFLPPLTIQDSLLDEALAVVGKAVGRLTEDVRQAV